MRTHAELRRYESEYLCVDLHVAYGDEEGSAASSFVSRR